MFLWLYERLYQRTVRKLQGISNHFSQRESGLLVVDRHPHPLVQHGFLLH